MLTADFAVVIFPETAGMAMETLSGIGRDLMDRGTHVWRLSSNQNVHDWERLGSLAVGGSMVLAFLARPSLRGAAVALAGGALVYRGVTGYCHLYRLMGIDTREGRKASTAIAALQGKKVEKTVFVRRPARDLYESWRKLDNLPQFMQHLVNVTELEGGRSHWVARGLLGTTVEWDAEIIEDRPGDVISWRSLPGADVETAGAVHFSEQPDGGTAVRVSLKYKPPAGRAGAAIAAALGQSVDERLEEDLQGFKQHMETASGAIRA